MTKFSGWGGVDVWALAFGYGFQLFFDFAGYSNIVIGTARLFGLRLAENFDRPYLSRSPSEFWTRWHMSLSFWIRDYVFYRWLRCGAEHGLALLRAVRGDGACLASGMELPCFMCCGVLITESFLLQSPVPKLGSPLEFTVPESLANFLSWSVTFPLMCLGLDSFPS